MRMIKSRFAIALQKAGNMMKAWMIFQWQMKESDLALHQYLEISYQQWILVPLVSSL